ncbi:MAG: glycogen-binding domain-containing protein [Phycisphaerales bacterium]
MSKRSSQCKPEGAAVSIKAPGAKEVFVAGTFNNWDPRAQVLKQSGKDGQWGTTLDLPPGRYEYKFIVDGRWCCEVGCDGPYNGCPSCVPNELGTMNRVLVVGEPAPDDDHAQGHR